MTPPLTAWRAQHEALDRAMAAWALATRGLFSRTPLAELLRWLDQRQHDSDFREIVPPVTVLATEFTARTRRLPSEATIMDLAAWNHARIAAAERISVP